MIERSENHTKHYKYNTSKVQFVSVELDSICLSEYQGISSQAKLQKITLSITKLQHVGGGGNKRNHVSRHIPCQYSDDKSL